MSKTRRRKPYGLGGNTPYMQAMQELRRSSAASKHRNKRKYTRKAKHKGASDD